MRGPEGLAGCKDYFFSVVPWRVCAQKAHYCLVREFQKNAHPSCPCAVSSPQSARDWVVHVTGEKNQTKRVRYLQQVLGRVHEQPGKSVEAARRSSDGSIVNRLAIVAKTRASRKVGIPPI